MPNQKCFISYAHVDKQFVYDEIIPILNELNLNVWLDIEQITPGTIILDTIIRGIRDADIIVCLLNKRSTFVNLELGAALGNNKPVLAIIHEDNLKDLPGDLRYLNYIRYSDNTIKEFKINLRRAIEHITENVIDKATFELEGKQKIIGLKAGVDFENFEQELKFTSDFIEFVNLITDNSPLELIQTSRGSFKSLISIDFKSWTKLLEKLIFIIPELKKRKAERLKVEAEIEKIHAETKSKNVDTNIKQAEAFIKLMEQYKKLGIKIQIDNDLLITQNQEGQLTFKRPKEL